MNLSVFKSVAIIGLSYSIGLTTVDQVSRSKYPDLLFNWARLGAPYTSPIPGPSRMLGLWLCIVNQIT